jgi:hypothetical protein
MTVSAKRAPVRIRALVASLSFLGIAACEHSNTASKSGVTGSKQEGGGPATDAMCTSTGSVPGIQDLDLAKCLSTPEVGAATETRTVDAPVILYLDRSASMHGFLDPNFPNIPTSYVRVLDRVVVGLGTKRAYSFGTKLKQVPVSTKDFETNSFYSDNNTRLQDALTKIAQDSQVSSTHVVITDGRRMGAAAADQQYADMRSLATDWISHGGTFAAAMSMARFNTVQTDPSGCRRGASQEPQTCPLYAFAFIARGGESAALNALSDVFEHFFVWPAPVIPAALLRITAIPGPTPVTLNPTWGATKSGAAIARTSSSAASNAPLAARVTLTDTTSARGQMLSRSLAGQHINAVLMLKALIPQHMSSPWTAPDPGTSVVRASRENQTLSIISRGALSPRSLIRLDLVSSGEPSWLPRVSASDANDVVHTYGLDRLFQGFKDEARNNPVPMGRLFLVAN